MPRTIIICSLGVLFILHIYHILLENSAIPPLVNHRFLKQYIWECLFYVTGRGVLHSTEVLVTQVTTKLQDFFFHFSDQKHYIPHITTTTSILQWKPSYFRNFVCLRHNLYFCRNRDYTLRMYTRHQKWFGKALLYCLQNLNSLGCIVLVLSVC